MLFDIEGLSDGDQKYNPKPIINEIRSHVASLRALPNELDWGVTHVTRHLLQHWRRTEVDATDEDELSEVFDTERHLFYVACTRARDSLHVSGVRPMSDFVADMAASFGDDAEFQR